MSILKPDGLNGETEIEIALIAIVKHHQVMMFDIPADDYKAVFDKYYMTPHNSFESVWGYRVLTNYIPYEEKQLINHLGLDIKDSRDKLEEAGADLDKLDKNNELYGNPIYKLYVNEVIPGFEENESAVIAVLN